MKFLLGTKSYMTQVYTDDGRVVPVTVIAAEPSVVTQVKTSESDGYTAVQVGYGDQKPQRLNKPQLGHLRKASADAKRYLREFRARWSADAETVNGQQPGEQIDVSAFQAGDEVTVSATSKGKGFQGVVKRHDFAGGPRTHGQKHSEREPGAIGAIGPQRVMKGKRMPGRMGGNRVTVRNLEVVQVDTEDNQIALKGAVPGRRGALVEVRQAQ
jgi:large subunit ribosomal protein L3